MNKASKAKSKASAIEKKSLNPNYATVGHIGVQIFKLVVLSVIIAPQNIITSHINKNPFAYFVSLNLHEHE